MGKWDGYLIVSDIDGTLINDGERISRENLDAIENFKSEGGLFTLASGRTLYDVTKIGEGLCNTHLIGHNGATLGRDSEVVWSVPFDKERLFRDAEYILQNAPYSDFEFLTTQGTFIMNPNEFTEIHKRYISDPIYKYINDFSEIPADVMMVACWMAEEDIPKMKKLVSDSGIAERHDTFQGFRLSYEWVPKNAGKGVAAKALKQITGAHTLVTAGDNFNDASMLEAGDISFTPRNAAPALRKMGTHKLTRHCSESIYPEVLEILKGLKR